MNRCSVVDVFCGVGGLTHGFVKEGFRVLAGVDSDASCRYAYEHNNGAVFIHSKIEDLAATDIRSLYPDQDIKILVGCAPCQQFSPYTKKQPKDEKWELLAKFSELIRAVEPTIVSMENVPELKTFKNGAIYSEFVASLTSTYTVTWYLVYCPDYGIPQPRERLVVFASKRGPIQLVEPTHTPDRYRVVADAISGLPHLQAGEVCKDDPLHRAAGLSALNLKRIRQSAPGSSWRDWDEELRASCHKKESGESYVSVYGRMFWTQPSPTITTQCYGYGNGRFGHPEQDRAISLREAALLQMFPRDYEFVGPDDGWSFKTLGRQIGNAVPVDLGRVIARSIKKHIEEDRER